MSESSPLLPRVDVTNGRERDQAGRGSCRSGPCKWLLVVVLVLAVAAVVTLVVLYTSKESQDDGYTASYGRYSTGAVVSDQFECSKIGSDMMELHQGSVVDAAVATLLCVGVTSAQACGIGGGHFMVIYDKPSGGGKKEVFAIDARETAPGAATKDMFQNSTDHAGPLTIAVPGTVRGLHEAWVRFGRLPWKKLVQPTVDLCEKGFKVNPILASRIQGTILPNRDRIPALAEVMLKPDGTPYKAGELMRRPVLAATLQRLADEGPESFYSGSVADDILADLNDTGSIIARSDLESYKTTFDKLKGVTMANGTLDLYTPLLPSGGPLVQYMLRILEGFRYLHTDQPTVDIRQNVAIHQAISETFKFGFAIRSFLGDDQFTDMTEVMKNLTSEEYIRYIQSRIDLAHTHGQAYYGADYLPPQDHGTSHIALVGPDGSAVSVTASINSYFGSFVYGERSGIIFNNEMDDFSSPYSDDFWGIRPSPANLIDPGKRPLSSMSPTLVVDHHSGLPRLVVGGAGGSHITTMVTLISYLNLMLGLDLKEAIDFPRIHSQLFPSLLYVEEDVDQSVISGLKAKGHNATVNSFLGVVCGIGRHCDDSLRTNYNEDDDCLYTAVGDGRRDAAVWGWN